MQAEPRPFQSWLEEYVSRHAACSGTIHTRDGDMLHLLAAVGIPEPVRAIVKQVPRGKGMAGLALERDAPVSTCNLQTDRTGDVRPGARAVDAQAAVALPIHDKSGAIRAVVGIAFKAERTLTPSDLANLQAEAELFPT